MKKFLTFFVLATAILISTPRQANAHRAASDKGACTLYSVENGNIISYDMGTSTKASCYEMYYNDDCSYGWSWSGNGLGQV